MITQQRAEKDLFCWDREGKTCRRLLWGYWFSRGRTAPLGPAGDRPMNDDTDGRNKAITGVCRRRFVKEAGSLARTAQGLDFSPSLLQPLRPRESSEHFLEALRILSGFLCKCQEGEESREAQRGLWPLAHGRHLLSIRRTSPLLHFLGEKKEAQRGSDSSLSHSWFPKSRWELTASALAWFTNLGVGAAERDWVPPEG